MARRVPKRPRGVEGRRKSVAAVAGMLDPPPRLCDGRARMYRRSLVAVAVLVAGVTLLAACAPSGHGHSLLGDPTPVGGVVVPTAPPPSPYTPPTSSTTSPTTTAVSTTTTTAAPAQARPYPVGWTTLDLTDPTRPTAF